ncbi:MAG: VWA domain-containing protein [Hyphomicrobiaceae bacterium]
MARVLAVLLATALAGPSVAHGETASLAVVLDASGSMWGNLAGAKPPKHALAREALRQALAGSAGRVAVGLAVFGGQGRDCGGAEMQVPIAPYSEATVIVPLEKLNPRGRGPLVLGLENAAKALASIKGPRTILVIHDGADNCNRDPCAAIEEIHAADPDLVVHAVGIGLKPEEQDALACVTSRTHGRRFTVDTESDLTRAITETVALATGPVAPPRPVAARPPARRDPVPASTPTIGATSLVAGVTAVDGPAGARLAAVVKNPGPALAADVRWTVARLDGDGQAPANTTAHADAMTHLALKPGRYRFTAHAGLVSKSVEADIAKDRESRIVVDLDAGLLRLAIGLGLSPEPPLEEAQIVLRSLTGDASGAPLYAGPVPAAPLAIAPGRYEIEIIAGLIRHRQAIDIVRGEVQQVAVALAGGELTLMLSTPATPLARPPILVVSSDAPKVGEPPVEIARSAAPAARFLLPAGSYTVSARAGVVAASQLVTVAPGEQVRRTLDLAPATIEARVTLGGATLGVDHSVLVTVTPRQAAPGRDDRRLEAHVAADTFRVGPGAWLVEARIPGQNLAATATTVVGAGDRRAVLLELQAGEITVVPPVDPAKARGTVTFVEVRDTAGALVWRAAGRAPRPALLAPGSYSVRAGAGSMEHEARVVVAAGERRVVDLSH